MTDSILYNPFRSIKPSRPPPPSSVNVRPQPRPSSNNPPPPPPMTKEEKHQAALAIREKRDREKQAAAAQLQQQQQQQQRQGGTGGVGGPSTTTAAQLLKTQQPLPKLRPPVAPPSRSSSINSNNNNNNSKSTVSQPRQAGTLPILNPGHTQRQVTPPMIPASGGDVGINKLSQGFMSAKGIKRKSTAEEGGGVGPFKSHTVSISNPSTAATRQPLGDLDVTDQGQIKRFRAS